MQLKAALRLHDDARVGARERASGGSRRSRARSRRPARRRRDGARRAGEGRAATAARSCAPDRRRARAGRRTTPRRRAAAYARALRGDEERLRRAIRRTTGRRRSARATAPRCSRPSKPAEAETVFAAELKRFPNDPHLEFGLAEALEAQGKDDAAPRAAYKAHWKGSARSHPRRPRLSRAAPPRRWLAAFGYAFAGLARGVAHAAQRAHPRGARGGSRSSRGALLRLPPLGWALLALRDRARDRGRAAQHGARGGGRPRLARRAPARQASQGRRRRGACWWPRARRGSPGRLRAVGAGCAGRRVLSRQGASAGVCYNGPRLSTDPLPSGSTPPPDAPMTSEAHWPEIVALVVLVGAAAFFAASEAAIVSINRIRARALAEKNVRGARRLEKLVENRNRTLTSVLIGSTFVLLAADSVATDAVHRAGHPARGGLVDDRHDRRDPALRRDLAQDDRGRLGRPHRAAAGAVPELRDARPLAAHRGASCGSPTA